MHRILDLSLGSPTDRKRVSIRVGQGCLVIGYEDGTEDTRVPANEVAVLIVGHRVSLTGAVLGYVTAQGGAVLAVDDRMRPAGLMLPIEGNRAHAERLRQQIARTAEVAPALWQQIVRAKLAAQAALVPAVGDLIERVQPADPDNLEAQAARIYWPALFGEGFTRGAETDENKALNYGYAVLRALVARAVCAAGLHPALGLHHHGWRDGFALADDLMEPARPLVDQVVRTLPAGAALDVAAKRSILGVVLSEVAMSHGQYKLLDAYELTCRSLVAVFDGERSSLELWT